MAKRDIIFDRINEGGATREILMEAADVDEKGLSSQLTYLRWQGKCPMMDPETKVFKIVSTEEWEEHKASRKGVGAQSKLTPEERLEKAEKRVGRASSALDKAKKRVDANDSVLNQKQFEKAKLELEISELLQNEAEESATAPVEEVEPPVQEPLDTEDDSGPAATIAEEPDEDAAEESDDGEFL